MIGSSILALPPYGGTCAGVPDNAAPISVTPPAINIYRLETFESVLFPNVSFIHFDLPIQKFARRIIPALGNHLSGGIVLA